MISDFCRDLNIVYFLLTPGKYPEENIQWNINMSVRLIVYEVLFLSQQSKIWPRCVTSEIYPTNSTYRNLTSEMISSYNYNNIPKITLMRM